MCYVALVGGYEAPPPTPPTPLTSLHGSSLTGSISALSTVYPDLGVIWIDAHADANTPASSPSMHYHGMPAAHLLGWFDPKQPVPVRAPVGAGVR